MPAPGRPYTLSEMKMIVEYLVEHRAYGEVKARKMWQVFASSGKVNRTWQSLKETFLKRILPDIHNTYYKLTPAQKRSFREGCDIEARESKSSGKLQMQTFEKSRSTGDHNENQGASCSKNTGEDNPDHISSKIISRSKASTDTIVLENNYETAEQILQDLESNEDKENSDEPQSPSKTLRDYIAYSEPLTPMLQEVIDDFATDEDEPQLQIVEDYEPVNGGNSVASERSEGPLEIRRSERLSPTKPLSGEKRAPQKENNKDRDESKGRSKSPSISKVRTLKLKKTRKGWQKKTQGSPSKKESGNDDKIDKAGETSVADERNKTVDKDGTTLTDTQLPNNQEQIGNNDNEKSIANDKRTSIEGSTEEFQETDKKKAVKRPRSRSASSTGGVKRKLRKDTLPEQQEIKEKIHKPLENNTQAPASIVDTQTYDSHPNILANKTAPENQNVTFNSHGNQVKLICENTQISQNDSTNKKEVPETNPCLQSVSLYAEQFSTTRYSDSEHGDDTAESKQTTSKEVQDDNSKNVQIDNSKKVQDDNSKKVQGDNSKKVQDANNAIKNSNDSNNSKNVQESNDSNRSECTNNAKKLPEKNNNTQVQSDNKIDNTESLTPKNKDTVGKTVQTFTQDVVVLKSNSESDQSQGQKSPQDQEGPKKVVRGRKSRDEVLANVFGFASGAVTLTTVSKKRGKVNVNPKYRHSCRRRTVSKNGFSRTHLDSGSSDYTSDSGSKEMSHFRDYVPPKSYKIQSHKGSKFVNIDNKIYQLVKTDKNGKMYIACGSDNDCEEETDLYWKAKYLEERKRLAEEKLRADELARLLNRANEREARRPRSISRSKSPMVMVSERSAKPRRRNDKDETIDISSDISKTSKESEKTVKIKFNNKKEIELECGWSHVPSVLEKMASILQQKDEAKSSAETLKVLEKTRTPTPEISEKVNRIESEIFKEIAEKDNIEKTSENSKVNRIESEIFKETAEKDNIEKRSENNVATIEEIARSGKVSDDNVTKRKRGRPRKTSPSSSISSVESSSSKTIKLSVNEQMPSPPKADNPSTKPEAEMPSHAPRTNKIQVQAVVEHEPTKRITRAPKKLSEVETLSTTTGSGSRSRSKLSVSERGHVDIPDDPNVKYKFPHRSRSLSDAAKTTRKYLTPSSRFLSPDHASRRSADSSQGYLDTDSSPSPLKKKKKRSSSLNRPKNTNSRKSYADSHPYQGDIDTCDSQRSQTPEKTAKTSTSPNKKSSPNTSVYRSDSFQLLMPQVTSVTHLDKIDEKSRSAETQYFSLSPTSVKVGDEFEYAAGTRTENTSSNISLISPEISVVEKLSVSIKETFLFDDSAGVPTIREIQDEGMETSAQAGNNMISEVDVGFPMIEQNCEVEKTAMSVSGSSLSTSASILKSITNAECEDQSLSDSLDVRLRDLFLESAKKIAQQMQERHLDKGNTDNMNIDQIMATVKKARGKRSSTPQKKRRSTKSTDATQPGPVLIEHVESCSKSKGGRRSCPPIINVIQCTSPPRTDVEEISAVEPAKRGRRQKDLIKVKIQRPRDKSLPKERRARSSSRMSVCTDSGINETDRTESDMMRWSDDSVQLIHNHSETCLQANECIGDDFQFPRKQPDKENNSVTSPDIFGKARASSNNRIEDLLCDDALDASSFISAARQSKSSQEVDSAPSSNPSTLSYGSLMTDDLSDEGAEPPKQSKWYLLSEDETNSMNDPKPPDNSAGNCFSHSNLKQLFLGYSIPDLSTISEEGSSKTNFDSNSH